MFEKPTSKALILCLAIAALSGVLGPALASPAVMASSPATTASVTTHLTSSHRNQPAIAAGSCTGFYDDFSSSLQPDWTWINEGRWSLTERPGYLRIYAETDRTYLLRETPNGIGEIWTRAEMQSGELYQQSTILIYQDDRNLLSLTWDFTFGPKVFFNHIRNGEIEAGFVSTPPAATTMALRIRQQGDAWAAEYRPISDGEPTRWTSVGHLQADLLNPRVGLIVRTTFNEGPEPPPEEPPAIPVDFDDFCLEPRITATLTPTFTPTFTQTPTPRPTSGTPPPPEDTEPPQLVTFDFEPKVINTAHTSQYVTVTMRLTDDLSGVDWGQIDFESASGNQRRGRAYNVRGALVSGDEHDGTYAVTMHWPRYSEMGPWWLSELRIEDRVGNGRRIDTNQMAARGFPTVLWVTTGEIHTVRLPAVFKKQKRDVQ